MSNFKEKAKDLAEKLGLKIEDLKEEQVEKFLAAKEALDKDTRRKVRAFWGPVGFVIGVVAGYALSAIL